jgi:nucleotide-binding universal stress UspA family protein
MRAYRRIMIPVDGSPTSNQALVAALQIARDSGGRVRLVHVVDAFAYLTGFEASAVVYEEIRKGAQRVLTAALEIANAAGVPVDTMLVDEPGRRLGECIADEAGKWEADLVVVGTHGRRGIARALLGSGAEQVIRLSPTPVLVIRGDLEDKS